MKSTRGFAAEAKPLAKLVAGGMPSIPTALYVVAA
jgi:hypothetical protein